MLSNDAFIWIFMLKALAIAVNLSATCCNALTSHWFTKISCISLVKDFADRESCNCVFWSGVGTNFVLCVDHDVLFISTMSDVVAIVRASALVSRLTSFNNATNSWSSTFGLLPVSSLISMV